MIGGGVYETQWEKDYRARERAKRDADKSRWREAVPLPRGWLKEGGLSSYGPAPRALSVKPVVKPLVSRGLLRRAKRDYFDELPAGAIRGLERRKPWMFDPEWTGSGVYTFGGQRADDRQYMKSQWRRRLQLARIHAMLNRQRGGLRSVPVPYDYDDIDMGQFYVPAVLPAAVLPAAVRAPAVQQPDIVMTAPAEDIVMRQRAAPKSYGIANYAWSGQKKIREFIPGSPSGGATPGGRKKGRADPVKYEMKWPKWSKKDSKTRKRREELQQAIEAVNAESAALEQQIAAGLLEDAQLRASLEAAAAHNRDVAAAAAGGAYVSPGITVVSPAAAAPAAGGAGISHPLSPPRVVRLPFDLSDARFSQTRSLPAPVSEGARIIDRAAGLSRGGLRKVEPGVVEQVVTTAENVAQPFFKAVQDYFSVPAVQPRFKPVVSIPAKTG